MLCKSHLFQINTNTSRQKKKRNSKSKKGNKCDKKEENHGQNKVKNLSDGNEKVKIYAHVLWMSH